MRWLFILLLLLNIIYFGWELERETRFQVANATPVIRVPVSAKRLTLISEMPSPPGLRTAEEMRDIPGIAAGDAVSSSATNELVAELPDIRPADLGDDSSASCFTFGPLPEERQAQGLMDWFRSRGAGTQIRHTDEQRRQLFWIYLAPQESKESAMAMMKELKTRGINDYRLISRGNLENAISLGLFSSQSAVNKRLGELKNKGYKPIVVPYSNLDQIYWLDIRLTVATGVIEEMFNGYPAQFKSVPVRCDDIAISKSEQ